MKELVLKKTQGHLPLSGFIVLSTKPNERILNRNQLKSLLCYNPQTGVFTWRDTVGVIGKIRGNRAGAISGYGYRRISVNGSSYRASRLACLYMTGQWPLFEMDHINRVRDDDRWKNLRDVTRKVNQANRTFSPRKPSPKKTHNIKITPPNIVTGVHWHKAASRWRATITFDGKRIWIGKFKYFIDAVRARFEKEKELDYYGDRKFESSAFRYLKKAILDKYPEEILS